MAQRSVRLMLRWATAAATLTLLPLSTIAASARTFAPSQRASEPISTRTLPTPESPDGSTLLALGARVLFVAGPGKKVRFRVDLRDGTLSTPNTPKLLEGVVDVKVAERLLFLCQAGSSVGSASSIVGFDLETGGEIVDAAPQARAASIDAGFCTRARPRHTPRSQNSPRLQNI